MTARKQKAPPVMGVAEIAAYCDVARPNVGKMLERNGVAPITELAVGKVYAYERLFTAQDVERIYDAAIADDLSVVDVIEILTEEGKLNLPATTVAAMQKQRRLDDRARAGDAKRRVAAVAKRGEG